MLPGCFLGGAGNERPVSMTLRDGEFVLHWCGEPTEELGYIELSYALYSPTRTNHVALRGEGAFVLRTGDEFTASSPPNGLEVLESHELPPEGNDRITVFLNSGSDEENFDGVRAILRVTSPRDLDGRWLYPSGEINDAPCEMRGAVS